MRAWIKAGHIVSSEGTTILYRYIGTPYCVESRKRHIPHAASKGGGTWDFTSYVVMKDEKEITTKYSLKAAKEYVEKEMGDESLQ